MDIDILYQNRFPSENVAKKARMWQVICKYLQRYIDKNSCTLDLAAGYCDFINNIKSGRKIAVDINPDMKKYANKDIEIIYAKSSNIEAIQSSSIDNIFISNFFEHIAKDEIINTLAECIRILKKNGKIIIMQPNIKYIGAAYWDFFDHHTPLTDKSMREVLEMLNFKIKLLVPRFLPYTTKSKIPQSSWLVSLYLHIPFVWRIMGQQMLIVAEK